MKQDLKKDKKKIKWNWKIICGFIAFQIIFAGITGPLLVYYGPFKNVTKGIVGGLEQTMTKQWINRVFLTQDEIDHIMGKNDVVENGDSEKKVDIKVSEHRNDDIKFKELNLDGAEGYVLEVDPRSIKIGLTSQLEVMGETTSKIAETNGAIAAINGGGFSDKSGNSKWAGTGAIPTGIVIQDGKIIWSQGGEDAKHTVFGFDKNGVMIVGKYSAKELINMDIQQALSFSDNSILVQNKVIKNNEAGLNPRTAIGQKEDGTVILVVVDGRDMQKMELGISTADLAKIMRDTLGAVNAFNLDGGKSSTMYYEGEIVNNPSEPSGERSVPTCVLVMPSE